MTLRIEIIGLGGIAQKVYLPLLCSDAKDSGLICSQFWTPLNSKKWLFWTVQNCLQKHRSTSFILNA
ncbi:MAG: hypothetical protein ACMX3H_14930 [Sodalis sp. (in: enterobacteria)]|uniref:hypothetical protein n=1 Tax=Sodalis sp. (in: enterobacteria) TaxID=1898979 RepID=UPI0039E5FA62